MTARNKKPGAKAGLVAIGDGVARYCASFAIWWLRRETLRLARFL